MLLHVHTTTCIVAVGYREWQIVVSSSPMISLHSALNNLKPYSKPELVFSKWVNYYWHIPHPIILRSFWV